MSPLVAYMIAPLLVWAGIFGYLLWLDIRLKMLEKRLDEEVRR